MSGERWTIGERLGAGFLLVFAVLLALLLVISRHMSENDRASQAVEAAIARSAQVSEIERSLLLFAVSTRDAVLERSPMSLQQFTAAQSRLQEALVALQRAAVATEDAAHARTLAGLVGQYAAAGARVVAGDEDTGALAALRTSVLTNLQDMQRDRGARIDAAIQRMESNRSNAAATLSAGAAITCLLFIGIAFLTVRSVRGPARELADMAGAVRAGEWQKAQALRPRDEAARFEMTQIAQAFAAAAGAVELREQRLMAHNEIASAASASLDRRQIAAGSLRAVLQHVQAEVGVLYGREPDTGTFVPLSSYATAHTPDSVNPGEGVVGQCALERRALVVRDIPRESAFAVKLGYDQAPPRMAAAAPILFNGKVIGVMLVASLRELDEGALGFLISAATQIGVGLANAAAYQEAQDLLARVRAQGEEIQAQNEELQAQSEELQAQSEELQAQSEELQAQSEEIRAQNDDLQRQATDLREHTELLRDADERKTHFLGVLAHELRNPLAPISSCVELLRRKGDDPGVFAHAQDVLGRQVRHITRLVDDLLDITRISRGKVLLRRQRLNVADLVRECIADQTAALEQRGIELTMELPQVPIYVEGDHTRLCQVLANLLSNAVKFCDGGTGIGVTVTLDAPAREVAIHVADDGMGIEPELLGRIFDPFVQAESELARTKGGLGLGLALAKGLLELHGGRIEARSRGRGAGAEFVVTLPLADAREHAPERRADTHKQQQTVARALSVLVIDDNVDAAQSLAKLLSMEDCQVEVAHTARAGLEAARRLRPQAVLCDIGLPDMDGYAFANEARRDPVLQASFLVALTGYGSDADQTRAAQAGFDVHMSKPADMDALLQAIRARDGGSQAS